MQFEPGDVQLISNHVILHARTAYEDAPEPRAPPPAAPVAVAARPGCVNPSLPLLWLL